MNMNIENCAVYGGSFDLPTLGHYQLIKKASTIFNFIWVVVAENASKKSPMFSLPERIEMMEDMAKQIDPYGKTIKIMALRSSDYLAKFAKNNGARFLVRGIRDQIDFSYEQNLYRTNRRIEPDVETIYLMPDDNYSLVSSSWVKSLIGCNGWVDVIRDSVTPFVLEALKKWYLKNKLLETLNSFKSLYNAPSEGDSLIIWDSVVKGYSGKSYHGLDHIIKMLEDLSIYAPEFINAPMIYSIFMHDVKKSEEESAKVAVDLLNFDMDCDCPHREIEKLILATKHDTCIYKTREEETIASIDLINLGGEPETYEKYLSMVFDEYWKDSGKSLGDFIPLWQEGRIAFLRKMLAREVIYPLSKIGITYIPSNGSIMETQARRNMEKELSNLLRDSL